MPNGVTFQESRKRARRDAEPIVGTNAEVLANHAWEAAEEAFSIVRAARADQTFEALSPAAFAHAFNNLAEHIDRLGRMDMSTWPRSSGVTMAHWDCASALAIIVRFAKAVYAEANIACQELYGTFPSRLDCDVADCGDWLNATIEGLNAKTLPVGVWDKCCQINQDVLRMHSLIEDELRRETEKGHKTMKVCAEIRHHLGLGIVEAEILGTRYAVMRGTLPEWDDEPDPDQIFVRVDDEEWEPIDQNIDIANKDGADLLDVLREVIFTGDKDQYRMDALTALDDAIKDARS